MKKVIKTTIYVAISIINIILVTAFLRTTRINYEIGFIFGFQYYLRVICGVLIYIFVFSFLLLLVFEHVKKTYHSIWWEVVSLVIFFAAVMANFF